MSAPRTVATGEYQPLAWQIVTDGLGYQSIHETDEDGNPGDIVAEVNSDHIMLLANAAELRSALIDLLAIAGTPITDRQVAIFDAARAVAARSGGAA